MLLRKVSDRQEKICEGIEDTSDISMITNLTSISMTDEVYTLSAKESMPSVHFPGSLPTEGENFSDDSSELYQEICPSIDNL